MGSRPLESTPGDPKRLAMVPAARPPRIDRTHAPDADRRSQFPTPERQSLIDQTLVALRSRIEARIWDDKLPGERHLCELLQVSRPTVRSALAILEKEGIISVTQGTNRAVRHLPALPNLSLVKDRHVVVLSRDARLEMAPSTLYLVDEMYAHLQKAGFRLAIESPAWLSYLDPAPYLEEYVKRNRPACWALFSVTEAVQRWFSKKGVPTLVSGSCYETIALPSIDFDYRAVTQHAIGAFLRSGCKRITLIIPRKFLPGDATTMDAFKEAITQSSDPELSSAIIRASSEKQIFEQQLEGLVGAPGGKHGLFVTDALKTLNLITYLQQKNHRIGSDFAVISRDEDFYLDHLVPSPARYCLHKKTFATKFCRMLLQLARTGRLEKKKTLIIPDFHPGETL